MMSQRGSEPVAYLLDTNVWIEALRRGNPHVVERFKRIGATELRLSTVVLGELLLA